MTTQCNGRIERPLAWTLLLVLCTLASGCKSPTPAEQMQTILSWMSTADMAAQAWVNHTTPEKYTRQTLELSEETIRQTTDDVLKSPLAGVDTSALDSLLVRSSGRIAQMARLIEGRNAPDVIRELDSLRVEKSEVKTIADKLEKSE
ncbi:MAG TPA: hypothetical protein VGD02_00060 [Gemmatimonadaceae bacterium]